MNRDLGLVSTAWHRAVAALGGGRARAVRRARASAVAAAAADVARDDGEARDDDGARARAALGARAARLRALLGVEPHWRLARLSRGARARAARARAAAAAAALLLDEARARARARACSLESICVENAFLAAAASAAAFAPSRLARR